MADTLADALNRVSADPQDASPPPAPAPHWTMRLARAVNSALPYINPYTAPAMYAKEIDDGTFTENTRERLGQLARIPTDVVGGVVSLPNLPATVSSIFGGPELPRSETLDNASESIHSVGQSVGEAIAGKPLSDSLLDGSPASLGASWGRLIAGAGIPMPSTWGARMTGALSKVAGGTETAQKISDGAFKTLEVLTPLSLNPKTAGVNAAVGTALAPAIELALTTNEQAKAEVQNSNTASQGALDVAAQGVKEAGDVHFQTVKAGFTTGDEATDATIAAGIGLAAAAVWGQHKFNIAGRVLDGTKKALTGYDPANVLDRTNASTWDLIQQQFKYGMQTPEAALRKALEEARAPNVEDRVMQIHESNASRRGSSVTTRMQSTITDGELLDSKIKINPIQNWYEMHGKLSDAQRDLLNKAILSQRELDTRRIHRVWHDLYTTDTRDLNGFVVQARHDPQVSLLMSEYFRTNRLLADYMAEQRRFSQSEINKFVRANPNYAASQLTEDGGRWLNERKLTMNGGLKSFEELGDVAKLWPQYIDEVIRSTEGKKIQRDFFTEAERLRARSPTISSMIGRTLTDAPPNNSKGLFVHWRNGFGESRWTEVHDAAVRNALQDATNPSALQLHKGWMDVFTRGYEGGAVGTAAATTGSVFAPTSMLYTSTFGRALRPKGIASSPLDRVVGDVTHHFLGKRIGVPGDVVTALPMDMYNIANNIAAVLYQRGGQAIRNSIIRDGRLANGLDAVLPHIPMGPNTADEAAKALTTWYKRSGVYEMQQRGNLGPSSFMSVDPSLSYKNAEQLLRANGLLGIAKETGTFISDILHAISSAPAMTTMQLNKGLVRSGELSQHALTNAIREMSGDPGSSGAFRHASKAAAVTNAVPWGNIFLQSGFRLIHGATKNPLGAAGGIFTAAVLPEVLAGMWAASQGQEYADYMYNKRSPDRLASSIYIALPGKRPEEGLEISIDPWLRPFKLMGSAVAGLHMGLLDGSLFHPDNDMERQSIVDAVNHRMFGFGKDTVPNAILHQTLIPPLPGPVEAFGAAHGFRLRGFGEAQAIQDKHNAGFTDGSGPRGTSFFGQMGMPWLEDVVRGVGATAGVNILHMLDDTLTRKFSESKLHRNEQDQPLGESLKQGVLRNLQQNLSDSTRMFGPGALFDGVTSISPSKEASAVRVQEKLDGLRKFSEMFSSATQAGGLPTAMSGNKKIGFRELPGVGPIGPQDMAEAVIGQEAKRIYQSLSTQYGAQRKQLYDERQSITTSSKYSPQMRRYLMNEYAERIIQLDRRMELEIERQEGAVSKQLGVPIKFDKLQMR